MSTGLLAKKNIVLNKEDTLFFNNHKQTIVDFYNNLKKIIVLNIKDLDLEFGTDSSSLNYYDIFYIMILKGSSSDSYQTILDKLYGEYFFKITKHAINKREERITINMLENIFNSLISFFDQQFVANTDAPKILSVDGTECRGYIHLKDCDFNSVPTDSYCEIFISSLYDSENDIPRGFTIDKVNNERESFKRLIKYMKHNDIVIFDRGYPSYEFMEFLNNNNFKFIIRAIKTMGPVKDIEHEHIADESYPNARKSFKNTKFRIIKYTIEKLENQYYLLTNIYDMTIEDLQILYFKRWRIEVFYDKLKNDAHGSYFKIKTEDHLYKCVWIKFIVILFTRIIINFAEKLFGKKDNNHKIDFKSALYISINVIFRDMIYTCDKYQYFFSHLLKINETCIISKPNRSFLRNPTKQNVLDKTKNTNNEKNKMNNELLNNINTTQNKKESTDKSQNNIICSPNKIKKIKINSKMNNLTNINQKNIFDYLSKK